MQFIFLASSVSPIIGRTVYLSQFIMHCQILYFYIEVIVISLTGGKVSIRLFGLYGKRTRSDGYLIASLEIRPTLHRQIPLQVQPSHYR